jgi:hypothetical protein
MQSGTRNTRRLGQAVKDNRTQMRVLLALEMSGVGREAFRKRGHDAWSCDLVPALDNSPYHIQDDVLNHLDDGWDLMIAHPVCRYLSNSGIKWLYIGGRKENGRDEQRWKDMYLAVSFFTKLVGCRIPRRCLENPMPHPYAEEIIGRSTQKVQPWMFGHGETKETHLWLYGLPKLVPTNVVEGRVPRVHYESPGIKNGLTREQRRSISFPGMLEAMAEQWGAVDRMG